MAIFCINAAQLEQNLEAPGVLTQAVAQKSLGFGNFTQSLAQPICSDHVGADILGIQLGGKAQPGQDFPDFGAVTQIA